MTKKVDSWSIIRYIILIGMTLVTLIPFAVLPLVSFKTKKEFMKFPLALPEHIQFDNYVTVFQRSKIVEAFCNSFSITAAALVIEIFVGALAAYALTKMFFKHSAKFSIAFLIPMVFPIQTITIPIYVIYNNLGLLNTRTGLVFIYVATGLPMVIFMLTSFMKTIPIQISESAVVDGAGHLTIFFKLIMPLLKPVTSTIIVINGLSIWNDFFLPLIMVTDKAKKTLPLKIYDFMGQYTSDWTLICTCIIYVTLPVIILYCILQKNIISGVVAGAVKG